ncbi:MAG: complex I NDUFA9 subunit family protein [Kiloniellaceae bacterium]
MPVRHVTVFGGTGFLGRRIVERLLDAGCRVRIAARRPQRWADTGGRSARVEGFAANLRDAGAVAAAMAGTDAVVNAVSLYWEHGGATFRSIHVDGARRLAEAARANDVRCLIHLSGIGADSGSASPYVRSRGEGDEAVRAAFGRAVIFRPSVMFGADDAFLNGLLPLIRRAPLLPLFGRGRCRLQPVYVGDVATAALRVISAPNLPARLFELGGPETFTYRELVELLAARTGRRLLLLPLPYAVWSALAALSAALPVPPLTEGQVALMKRDNLAAPDLPGLAALGIVPTGIGTVLQRDFGL